MRLRVVSPGFLAEAAAIALLAALMTEQANMKAAASRAGRRSRFHVCKYTFNYLRPLPNMLHVEHLLIFLASPGDVPRERKYVDEMVTEVNRTVANPRGIVLTVRRWERDTFAEYGGDPQSLVNAQIADMKQYALFVGIMWSRLGTPTKNALSGTVEEFDRAVVARRRTRPARPSIMFFFRDAPFNPTHQDEMDQKGKVLEFRKRVQRGGLTASYKTPLQFRDEFRNQLILWLNCRAPAKAVTNGSAVRGSASSPRTTTPALNPPGRKPVAALPPAKPTSKAPAPRAATTSINAKTSVLLDDKLYRSESVNTRTDQSVVLRLLPQNASEKAALNALRPPPYQQKNQKSFAFQDDGFSCRVESVETESRNGNTAYIITLTPDDQRHGGLSDFGTTARTERRGAGLHGGASIHVSAALGGTVCRHTARPARRHGSPGRAGAAAGTRAKLTFKIASPCCAHFCATNEHYNRANLFMA